MTRPTPLPFYYPSRIKLYMAILATVWAVVIVGMLLNPSWRTPVPALVGGWSMMFVFILAVWCHRPRQQMHETRNNK